MHDRARLEYAAGATWHDLHAFASARQAARARGEPTTGQLRGRLEMNLAISIVLEIQVCLLMLLLDYLMQRCAIIVLYSFIISIHT